MKRLSQKGFTLIELIAVIVVLSVAGTALTSLFTGLSGQQGLTNDLNSATQVGRACTEQILITRRKGAWPLVGPQTACDVLTNYNGFSASYVVAAYAGAACPPAPANCRQVTITTTNGTTTHVTNLLFTDY